MNAKLLILFWFLYFLVSSCKENNALNFENNIDSSSSNFALILCEGLWGYNNSIVSKLNLLNFNLIKDFTSNENPNFKIGDLGNDIVLKGDTFFVVVTTSKAVEFFDVKSGKLLGYITFEGNSAPRRLALINDSLFAVTDLYQDCIHIVNYRTKNIVKQIKVGPAPEFVVYFEGKLYVANSGYGDFRANEPKAGTLSVIDVNTLVEERVVHVGPNPIEIVIDGRKKLMFVSYNNLPSFKDSIGGIVIFDLNSLSKVNEYKTFARSFFLVEGSSSLFFISNNKVLKLNYYLNKIDTILINPDTRENWYSVAFDWKDGHLFVGNARNYAVEGEILIYKLTENNTEFIKKMSVGVNPSKIVLKR